jgi:hypothetical protein
MIAFPFALLLAFAALVLGILIGRQVLFRKSMGEALVAKIITESFQRPHVLLNNVTLNMESGTTQIDHVLIADTGIFVIETKHYQGWIYGSPNQSQWTQVIYKKKSRFQNPIRQNYGHLKTLQSLFTLPAENFFSVVVFTGSAEFKTDLGPNVLHLSQLIPWLTTERPVIFDERKLAYIVGRIEMKRLRHSLETDEYHLNYVREKIRERG